MSIKLRLTIVDRFVLNTVVPTKRIRVKQLVPLLALSKNRPRAIVDILPSKIPLTHWRSGCSKTHEREIKPKLLCIALLLMLNFCLPVHALSESFDQDLPENKCTSGGALDQFDCYSEALERVEKKMNDLIVRAENNIQSTWGKQGIAELKERLRKSQKAWIEYSNELCMRNYYKKAPSHPPSLSLEMTACKFYKTQERIKEIQETYFSS